MLAAALLLPTLLTGDPPPGAVQLAEPRVQYRMNEASATRSPWIDANGWKILRDPGRTYVYNVKGQATALAAAEAFTYGAPALISTPDPANFEKMLAFLKTVPLADVSPASDFGVVDDRSDAAGELLNLLTRMNLLFKIEKAADPKFTVNVRLGTKEYSVEEAKNPSVIAHKIRSQIGDDNRSLRIYGSETVIARVLLGPNRARVFLLNYAARPVLGLRVRVRGAYSKGEIRAPEPDPRLTDWTRDASATEFTLSDLGVLAVVDLTRN